MLYTRKDRTPLYTKNNSTEAKNDHCEICKNGLMGIERTADFEDCDDRGRCRSPYYAPARSAFAPCASGDDVLGNKRDNDTEENLRNDEGQNTL